MMLHKLLSCVVLVVMMTSMVSVFLPFELAQAESANLNSNPTPTSKTFKNPLPKGTTIDDALVKIIKFLLGLVGLLALLALIWGGITMIIGFGSEQRVAHAKQIIFWAIVGLAVAGLSYVIVRIVAVDLLGIA